MKLMLFLGALVEFRKATVCQSARPSVRTKQLDSQLTDFDEIWYLKFLQKSV
jgi:hypothetical protein